MALQYLIISESYYTLELQQEINGESVICFQERFSFICNYFMNKKQPINFACFRYANATDLTKYEWEILISFLTLCYHYKIYPLINFSSHKIEILYSLLLHGFCVGIHFKEADKSLIQQDICKMILQDYMSLKDSIHHLEFSHNILHSLSNRFVTFEVLLSYCKSLSPLLKNLQHCYQPQDLFFFYSGHNEWDLRSAFLHGIHYATISPIFYDKGNRALGLQYLRKLPHYLKTKSIALGGVETDERVQEVLDSGVIGFASIRYFTRFLH